MILICQFLGQGAFLWTNKAESNQEPTIKSLIAAFGARGGTQTVAGTGTSHSAEPISVMGFGLPSPCSIIAPKPTFDESTTFVGNQVWSSPHSHKGTLVVS